MRKSIRSEGHGWCLGSDSLGAVLELAGLVRLWLSWEHWLTVWSRAQHPLPLEGQTIELHPATDAPMLARSLTIRGDSLLLRYAVQGGPLAVQLFEVPPAVLDSLQCLMAERASSQMAPAQPQPPVRVVRGRAALRSAIDPDAWETEDGARWYFCAGAGCPGYPIRASRFGHPSSCSGVPS